MLQDSAIIKKVRTVLQNRCIRFLADKLRKEPESYFEFFKDYGIFLKEGRYAALLIHGPLFVLHLFYDLVIVILKMWQWEAYCVLYFIYHILVEYRPDKWIFMVQIIIVFYSPLALKRKRPGFCWKLGFLFFVFVLMLFSGIYYTRLPVTRWVKSIYL